MTKEIVEKHVRKSVDLSQSDWRPSDGVAGLIRQTSAAHITKKGALKNNSLVTARVLDSGDSIPPWWERVSTYIGKMFSLGADDAKTLKIYKCRVEQDSRCYGVPEPTSAEDNVIFELPQMVFESEIAESLGPGNIVQVRITNANTCFVDDIAGSIVKLIDSTSNFNNLSSNCTRPVPGAGGKTNTLSGCTVSRRSKSTAKRVSIPRSTSGKGKSPLGPITASPTVSSTDVGIITSGFGWRNPPPGGSADHTGIDIRVPVGTAVYAVLDGEVIYAVQSGNPDREGAGYYAVIKHTVYEAHTPNSEFYTLYAHLEKESVITQNRFFGTGTRVKAGTQIATSGESGAGGPHLHFGIIYDSDPGWTTGGQVSQYGAKSNPMTDFFTNKFVKKKK